MKLKTRFITRKYKPKSSKNLKLISKAKTLCSAKKKVCKISIKTKNTNKPVTYIDPNSKIVSVFFFIKRQEKNIKLTIKHKSAA